jgi:hypothetical protein
MYCSFAKNSNTFFNEMVLGQFFTSSASVALGMFEFTLVSCEIIEMKKLFILCELGRAFEQ